MAKEQEELDLLRLRAKAKLKLKNKSSQEQAPNTDAIVEPTTGEAMAAGAVEGIPFLKDAIASYEAIKDEVADEEPFSVEGIHSKYKERLDDINQTINQAEEAAPIAIGVGDFASSVATIPFGAGVKAAAAVGAASGLSRSENRDATDLVTGAAVGAIGHGIGKVAGKGIGKGLKGIKNWMGSKSDDAFLSALRIDKSRFANKLYKHNKRMGQSNSDFVESLRKMKIGDEDIFEAGDSAPRMLEKVKMLTKKTGQELDSIYKQIDNEIKPEIDINRVKDDIITDVVPELINSDDPATQKIGREIMDYVQQVGQKRGKLSKVLKPSGAMDDAGNPIMVEEITEELIEDSKWGIHRLNNLRKSIDSKVQSLYSSNVKNSADASVKSQQKKIADSLRRIVNDEVSSLDIQNPGIKSALDSTKKSFGNAALVREVLEETVSKATPNVFDAVQNLVSTRTALLMGVGGKFGGPVGAVGAFAVDRILKSPRTPQYVAKGLPKVMSLIAANPTGKVATRLTTAAALSTEKFKDTLDATLAETELSLNPVPRDTNKAVDSIDDLRRLVKYHTPSLLDNFDTVIEEGDDDQFAKMLDMVSKSPKVAPLFEDGVGFNGKVYNEEDKAIFENQLKNTDIPGVQRLKMLKALRKDGIIPKLDEVEKRKPLPLIPRRKDVAPY